MSLIELKKSLSNVENDIAILENKGANSTLTWQDNFDYEVLQNTRELLTARIAAAQKKTYQRESIFQDQVPQNQPPQNFASLFDQKAPQEAIIFQNQQPQSIIFQDQVPQNQQLQDFASVADQNGNQYIF